MSRLAWMVIALAGLVSPALAQTKVETVCEGLNNPTGVAIQPNTGHVYVAESGAQRIVRIVDGKPQEVITGFDKDVYGKEPAINIGPLGLAFFEESLVVGDGGRLDGEDELLVFTLPKPGEPAIAIDQAKFRFALPAKGDTPGEGNFHGVAVAKQGIYVTCHGDDAQGWIAKANTNGTKVEGFTRHIATKPAVQVNAPLGIAISPRGEIVVGQGGKIDVAGDGLVSFYSARTGQLWANFETGLYDATGLAYSPRGQLYAVDFAWMDTAKGGLYQLVADRRENLQAVKAQLVTPLVRPTAMAFAPDGALYITLLGEPNTSSGKLVRIAPGL